MRHDLLRMSNFNFLNDNFGYLVTYDDSDETFYLYKTTDGGDTWVNIYNLGEYDIYNEYRTNITFYDSLTGLISISDKLFKTTDSGNNWETVLNLYDEYQEINHIMYLSKDTLFISIAYTLDPVVIRSFNGGDSFVFDTINQPYSQNS